jgi:hypothetical protein
MACVFYKQVAPDGAGCPFYWCINIKLPKKAKLFTKQLADLKIKHPHRKRKRLNHS